MRGDRDGGGSGCYGNNDGSGYDGDDGGDNGRTNGSDGGGGCCYGRKKNWE